MKFITDNSWEEYLKEIPDEKKGKYMTSGIYAIYIEDKLVYIGQSRDMLKRVCQHLECIDKCNSPRDCNKYRVLHMAQIKSKKISFDVMQYAAEDDLDKVEGELIRKYIPDLNYQIPKENGGWTANRRAKWVRLKDILGMDIIEF